MQISGKEGKLGKMQMHGGEKQKAVFLQIGQSIKGVSGRWDQAGGWQMRQKIKWESREEKGSDGLCLLY